MRDRRPLRDVCRAANARSRAAACFARGVRARWRVRLSRAVRSTERRKRNTRAEARSLRARAGRAETRRAGVRRASCIASSCREEIPESFRAPPPRAPRLRSEPQRSRERTRATPRRRPRAMPGEQTTVVGATRTAGSASDAAAEDRGRRWRGRRRGGPARRAPARCSRGSARPGSRARSRARRSSARAGQNRTRRTRLRTPHPRERRAERERFWRRTLSEGGTKADRGVAPERADEALAWRPIEDAFENAPKTCGPCVFPRTTPKRCDCGSIQSPGRSPKTPPLVSVRQPNLPPAIRMIRRVTARRVEPRRGARCGDRGLALAEWLREYMPAILDEHGGDGRRVSRAERRRRRRRRRPVRPRRRRPAARARGFLAGHTKFERTFAKIEAEREAEREEEGPHEAPKERQGGVDKFLSRRRNAETRARRGWRRGCETLAAAADTEATRDPR